MEEADGSSVSLQVIAQEPGLEAHTELLALQSHPLHRAGDRDVPKFPVACFTLVELVDDDLVGFLHGHKQTGERAVSDCAGNYSLAAFGLGYLAEFDVAVVQGRHGVETHVTVPARYHGDELLGRNQLDLMDLLIVSNLDNLCDSHRKTITQLCLLSAENADYIDKLTIFGYMNNI